jgi:hypothetical protein
MGFGQGTPGAGQAEPPAPPKSSAPIGPIVSQKCRNSRARACPATGVSTFSTGIGASMPRSPRRVRLVLARSQAPPGASENSPGRKPCGTGTETRQPRRGVRRLFAPGNRFFPVERFFRPSGALYRTRLFPWLTPWAIFFRPSGALYPTRLFPWLTPWAIFWRPYGADAHEGADEM